MSFEPLQGVADTDITSFLRNQHENIISCAIENQKTASAMDFQRAFEQAIQRDWDQAKRRIMDEMGHQSSGAMDTSFLMSQRVGYKVLI